MRSITFTIAALVATQVSSKTLPLEAHGEVHPKPSTESHLFTREIHGEGTLEKHGEIHPIVEEKNPFTKEVHANDYWQDEAKKWDDFNQKQAEQWSKIGMDAAKKWSEAGGWYDNEYVEPVHERRDFEDEPVHHDDARYLHERLAHEVDVPAPHEYYEHEDRHYQHGNSVTDIGASKSLGIRGQNQVNALRAKVGKAPLQWSDIIHKVAYPWSVSQAALQRISHDGVSGRYAQIASQMGSWRGAAENVAENWATGAAGVDMCIEQWTHSPGHYANMVGDFTHAAIAVVTGNNNRTYCTHIFIKK